jgi:hypothetical protein
VSALAVGAIAAIGLTGHKLSAERVVPAAVGGEGAGVSRREPYQVTRPGKDRGARVVRRQERHRQEERARGRRSMTSTASSRLTSVW